MQLQSILIATIIWLQTVSHHLASNITDGIKDGIDSLMDIITLATDANYGAPATATSFFILGFALAYLKPMLLELCMYATGGVALQTLRVPTNALAMLKFAFGPSSSLPIKPTACLTVDTNAELLGDKTPRQQCSALEPAFAAKPAADAKPGTALKPVATAKPAAAVRPALVKVEITFLTNGEMGFVHVNRKKAVVVYNQKRAMIDA